MKTTINYIIFVIGFFILPMTVKSQESTATYEAGPRAKTIYVELGGPGFISANYDFRFQETRNSWGMRAGVGYFSVEDEGFFTVPVQVNYLLGKDGNYFEMGAGLTYYNVSYTQYDYNGGWGNSVARKERDSQVMGSMTFGYRKQPVDGGFNFRAGLSPIFMEGNFIPYLPYISFGYSF